MYPSLFTTPGLAAFAEELDAERARQIAKFGDQQHPDGTGTLEQQKYAETVRRWCDVAFGTGYGTWVDILDKEIAEAKAERDPAKLRAELIQVAAVCAAWASDLDRRPTTAPCTAALVPLDNDPVERCTETGRHDLHRTAAGETWTTSSR